MVFIVLIFSKVYNYNKKKHLIGELKNMKKVKKGETISEDCYIINSSEKEFLDLGTSLVRAYLENKHCNGGCGSCQ